MAGEREVRWSHEASEQVEAIKAFVREQWSDREVRAFLDLLRSFEKLVGRFPNGYLASTLYPGCGRPVIHPNVSVVYRVTGSLIEVVTVCDNRSARSQR
jgi:plasmid stabilization system protein ParE